LAAKRGALSLVCWIAETCINFQREGALCAVNLFDVGKGGQKCYFFLSHLPELPFLRWGGKFAKQLY